MSRYAAMFDRLSARGEGAFGAFLILGDPDLETSARLLDAAVEGGADMIEVGIPFSDPVADGPVIQAAAARALHAGAKVADCFELLRAFRQRHGQVPIGLLTYANLLVARGVDGFCAAAAEAGVDSLLIADVPSIEAEPFAATARRAGLDLVMIAAPNTPRPALERIARLASGYTYCVARSGVTGVSESLSLDHRRLFEQLAALRTPPPSTRSRTWSCPRRCSASESRLPRRSPKRSRRAPPESSAARRSSASWPKARNRRRG